MLRLADPGVEYDIVWLRCVAEHAFLVMSHHVTWHVSSTPGGATAAVTSGWGTILWFSGCKSGHDAPQHVVAAPGGWSCRALECPT